tara:strand:+ start:3521 stop:3685 length:165 start_codon:yes stop_codon:yes gene_type:complete
MNEKEWKKYINNIYMLHLTLGGSDETFPKVLKNIGVCTECIRNKNRCTCVEVSA